MTRGGSSMVEQSLFQGMNGGPIPTSPLQYRVVKCRFSDIRHIFEEFHYKGGHMGGGISFCMALMQGTEVVGGAVIGKPRHEKKYSDKGVVLEIRRMALKDECPKNSESYFLSKVIWFVKKNKLAQRIISYSDTSVGHMGTIYKAANFKLVGETSPSKHVFWNGVRYHPRSLTIERPYSHKLREAVANGTAKVETGTPKLIFVYEI